MRINDEIMQVLQLLRNAGGRPLIVGGAVRDHLLGLDPKDYDIEVYGLSIEDLEAALSAQYEVNAVGRSFGILKVSLSDDELDISLPRSESKVGAGHKGFVTTPDPNMSFVEASARRDFTINAMGYDPFTEEILDPHGGRQDLGMELIRHTSEHFSEDPLRVLRACQFAARLGFTIDDDTIDLCYSLKDQLSELSPERVWGELVKLLLKSTNPSVGLNYLEETGALSLFPELQALIGIPQEYAWHPEGWAAVAGFPANKGNDSGYDSSNDPGLHIVLEHGGMHRIGHLQAGATFVVVPFSQTCFRCAKSGQENPEDVVRALIGPAVSYTNHLFCGADYEPVSWEDKNGFIGSVGGLKISAIDFRYDTQRDGSVIAYCHGFPKTVGGGIYVEYENSLWVHNCMVTDEAAKIIRRDNLLEENPKEALITMLGALCHDLGKPDTTEFVDNRWRSRSHEEQGEQPTIDFLTRLRAPNDIIEAVVPVVKDHLKPAIFYKDKAGLGAIRRLALRVPLNRLLRVAEADHYGRSTQDAINREPYAYGPWLLEQAEKASVKDSGPTPLLMGRHLLDMGFTPGRELGVKLKAAFEAQLDGIFEDEEGAIQWAKEAFTVQD